MTKDAMTRGIAAGAATTLAVGALALLGTGIAGAASGSVTWDEGAARFTRTVSNTTPAVGETVTVTTKFDRTSWVDEFIYNVKDRHPSCLTYIPGSAKMTGNGAAQPVANPEVVVDEGNGRGYVRGAWGVTDWVIQNRPGFVQTPVFSVSYTAGKNCARDTALLTGMEYGGSLGGTNSLRGPSITMSKTGTATALAAVTGARVGVPSTLTATVTGGEAGNTVEFRDAGTKVGQAALDGSGRATLAWTPATAGSRAVTAHFVGTGFAAASQSSTVTVQVAARNTPSTIALAPVTDAQVGRASTITVTVTPAGAGGTVTFKDGDIVIGTAQVGADGTATTEWTPAAAGQSTITAEYSGNGTVTASSVQESVTVAPADEGGTGSLGSLGGFGSSN
ncbi:Ig-like domain-containing protein [Rhodococcus tukisamuensis]|uniref:Ig-like domain (Group 3) n=1 Tax=Rhodococcus tukisamuensis TaxID=168276 RepID=A0A1G6W4V8_9NOCA|nr:Ig-like domain-containing protein [Rhodococcus tukisamuensis]SDD60828.1 Ig-like domain (group 3) [Rhodococcus tukisamuensis]